MDKQPSICLNPSVSVSALMTLVDFTLSNARQFYSSMGSLWDTEGLMSKQSIENLNSRKSIPGNESHQINIFFIEEKCFTCDDTSKSSTSLVAETTTADT